MTFDERAMISHFEEVASDYQSIVFVTQFVRIKYLSHAPLIKYLKYRDWIKSNRVIFQIYWRSDVEGVNCDSRQSYSNILARSFADLIVLHLTRFHISLIHRSQRTDFIQHVELH